MTKGGSRINLSKPEVSGKAYKSTSEAPKPATPEIQGPPKTMMTETPEISMADIKIEGAKPEIQGPPKTMMTEEGYIRGPPKSEMGSGPYIRGPPKSEMGSGPYPPPIDPFIIQGKSIFSKDVSIEEGAKFLGDAEGVRNLTSEELEIINEQLPEGEVISDRFIIEDYTKLKSYLNTKPEGYAFGIKNPKNVKSETDILSTIEEANDMLFMDIKGKGLRYRYRRALQQINLGATPEITLGATPEMKIQGYNTARPYLKKMYKLVKKYEKPGITKKKAKAYIDRMDKARVDMDVALANKGLTPRQYARRGVEAVGRGGKAIAQKGAEAYRGIRTDISEGGVYSAFKNRAGVWIVLGGSVGVGYLVFNVFREGSFLGGVKDTFDKDSIMWHLFDFIEQNKTIFMILIFAIAVYILYKIFWPKAKSVGQITRGIQGATI